MACSRISDSPIAGELGVDRDGAIDFAALAHQAAERELDVGLVRFGREPREHFRGAIESVVDQMIETGEIVDVAAQPPAARRAAAEREGGRPDDEETQQENFGTDAAQAHGGNLSRSTPQFSRRRRFGGVKSAARSRWQVRASCQSFQKFG